MHTPTMEQRDYGYGSVNTLLHRCNDVTFQQYWLSRDLFSVLSVQHLYNEDLFKVQLVESPGGFSSWEYQDENGACP
jgi:hypothetical protein